MDTANGVAFDIDVKDVVFIKYFNPSVEIMQEWRGLSPVKVLSRTLTMMESGENVTTAQLQNGGVPGIVYDKTPGLDNTVISKRRDNFGRFLRNSDNKGAPYFSANELGYIALGTPLTDMEVTALASANRDMVCNVYGVSSVLFNDKSASTESNVQEMVKEMYINTIIPNVHRVESALNKGVVPDLVTKGIVKCDTSEIKALHDDEAKKAAALAQKWWLTGNERREADGYDQDTADELMDKYIIPSGMTLLDDLSMVTPDVNNAAGDYTPPKVVPLKQANG
jgi:phage portal protein BeeE